jgi:putative ATP-dependent endonuclease of OLD family
MVELTNVAAKIADYKCFGADAYGFDCILPINLIIGRNNSGKSALLDLIDFLTAPRNLDQLGHQGKKPKVILSSPLIASELQQAFSESTSGGRIPGANHWQYGKQWIGKPFSWIVADGGQLGYHSSEPAFDLNIVGDSPNILARVKGNPFSQLRFKRLDADRNIVPESDSGDRIVKSSGAGATNLVQNFINKVDLPRSLVENTLLRELNAIFEPDGTFTDIVVEQDGNGIWEIRIAEEHKGHVPLSHTGSGIKTILLVLIFLHLVPRIEGRALVDYVFGFEELENNLHPALQRRLLGYLRRIATKEGCRFFLTTHSNVAIDMFAHDREAQVLHVTHDRKSASLKNVVTYVDNRGILDDLDVRASDLLQANGIIWLEGPSDRLYFNRWMELLSQGAIKEGAHYQCVFYGGRLLAHLSAADPTVDADEVVRILRVNRNAILIVDSDRTTVDQEINSTKQRLLREIEALDGIAWLTAGREIENYIPDSVIFGLYPEANLSTRTPYSDFVETLEGIELNEGKRFAKNKVLFAEKILPLLSLDNLQPVLDWKDKASQILDRINTWNGMIQSLEPQ